MPSFFANVRKTFDGFFFSDMHPLIRRGMSKVIGPEDLPPLPAALDPRREFPDFAGVPGSTPGGFLRGLLRVMRREFLILLCLGLSMLVLDLLSPILIGRLLSIIGAASEGGADLLLVTGAAVGLCLASLGSAVVRQHYYDKFLFTNQRIVNGLNIRIFRHALSLTRNARTATPVGDLVNHLTTDVETIADIPLFVCEMLINILTVIAVVGLLIWRLGPAGLVAIAVLALLLPVTRVVARRVIRLDDAIMKKRDERVSLMSQVLSGIRIIKYFAWEPRFRAEIEGIREAEIRGRKSLVGTESFSLLFYAGTTTMMALASFAVFLAMGGTLNAPLVFSCIAFFSLLQHPFGFLPNLISQLASARVSADRLIKFFGKDTLAPADRTMAHGPGRVSLRIDSLSVRYPDSPADALQDVTVEVKPGEKLAIVGPVGCGKSTLLAALLGELEPRDGRILYHGPDGAACRPKVAYASQEPFIMNATLRRNILFGEADADIDTAVDAAALARDVASLPAGLETEIGEHGINLSGGQRQRVCLARAVARRPDLVLLDDPLSAVDEHTEDVLVEKLIWGAFHDTTLVMSTHRLRSLHRFDRIAFMENGRVVDSGPFDVLKERCPRFADFLAENERRSGAAGKPVAAAPPTSVAAAGDASGAHNGRITEEEDRESGAVPAGLYLDYVKALGGKNRRTYPWILAALVATTIAMPLFGVLEYAWLARWTNALAQAAGGRLVVPALGRTFTITNTTALAVYAAFGLTAVALVFAQFTFWAHRAIVAARNYHDSALAGVLTTRIRFFDSTPVGRILNRFSRDVDSVERQLAESFAETVRHILWTLGSLVVIGAVLPVTLVFMLPCLLAYYRLQLQYRSTARETKRLHSVTRSPRFAHFKETLQGLTVLRAYSKQGVFYADFLEALAENQRMFYGMCRVNRWFSIRIPLLSGVIATGVVVGIAVGAREGVLAAGTAGLVLKYSLEFWGSMNWAIRAFSEAESKLTSVERLTHYARLEREPRLLIENTLSEAHQWPLAGEIVFDRVHARYDASLPKVLRGVTFRVPQGTSVGIIGRTGSGKSTLFQVLFRLVDICEGRIMIDGHDIRSVPLELLRRSIAIIPQDPMLFQGTLRKNLDRFEIYEDREIWRALARVGLDSFVAALPGQFEAPVQENGYNYSQGQRQLFCLARALLTKAKIIVLDEATASVDVETDSLIQRTIRIECGGITRLIIAHRTETLADCDKIIEIAEGVVVREEIPEHAGRVAAEKVEGALAGHEPPWNPVREWPFKDPSEDMERPKSLV